MNCKPGDLAVIVRSTRGQEGKIVRCLRQLGQIKFDDGLFYSDVWLVEGRGLFPCHNSRSMGGDGMISDTWLRPIRDNDGTDETLTLAPKREGVTA